MRHTLLLSILPALLPGIFNAQPQLTSQEFGEYYDWFNEQSQVAQLYTDRSTLYVFTQDAALHAGPCRESKVMAELPIGWPVTNIVEDEFFMPEGEVNGYFDLWFYVTGSDRSGQPFQGYLWGGDVAKSWRSADLTGDDREEFLMLGIPARARTQPTEINAEVRVLHNGRLWYQKVVPGLCVFEECATSSLLRVVEYPQWPDLRIIEASTLTLGCWAGVEKALFYWNGSRLERVFYAEFTTAREYENKPFVHASGGDTQLCRYSHEDEDYNPVWDCKTVKVAPPAAPGTAVALVK